MVKEEPTRSLRAELSQNLVEQKFLQESTRGKEELTLGLRPEFYKELCQKVFLLRSLLLIKREPTLGLRPKFLQNSPRTELSLGVNSPESRVDSVSA